MTNKGQIRPIDVGLQKMSGVEDHLIFSLMEEHHLIRHTYEEFLSLLRDEGYLALLPEEDDHPVNPGVTYHLQGVGDLPVHLPGKGNLPVLLPGVGDLLALPLGEGDLPVHLPNVENLLVLLLDEGDLPTPLLNEENLLARLLDTKDNQDHLVVHLQERKINLQ